MKKHTQIILAAILTSVLLTLTYFMIKYEHIRKEIVLRNAVEAEVQSRDNCISTCFSVIKQVCQVTDAARASFEKVYPEIMREGIGKGGTLMKWVQSNAPSFDINKNFERLAVVIEAQRMDLRAKQDKMVDMAREYKVFTEDPITRWFVGVKSPINVTVIVTGSAQDAIATGVESDENLSLKLGN